MIDYFALALTHALILLALLRILVRDELDREDPASGKRAAGLSGPRPSTRREARRARREQRDDTGA